eukprot:Lithocolla_globosa_v1_NODE_783_length_3285_cov_8.409598.p3 type:complete len:134 gc:universal NODE_783_length_3285_cov_8.409598:332-733(+)
MSREAEVKHTPKPWWMACGVVIICLLLVSVFLYICTGKRVRTSVDEEYTVEQIRAENFECRVCCFTAKTASGLTNHAKKHARKQRLVDTFSFLPQQDKILLDPPLITFDRSQSSCRREHTFARSWFSLSDIRL